MITALSGAALLLAGTAEARFFADASLLRENDRAVLDVFFKVCGNGQAKFKATEIENIDRKRMPKVLQEYYASTRAPRFYKLVSNDPSYLIMFKRENAQSYLFTEGCALASSSLPMFPAYALVQERLSGIPVKAPPYTNKTVKMTFLGPNSDYQVSVQRIGIRTSAFTVVQTSLYNPQMIVREREEERKRRVILEQRNKRD